MQRNFCRNLGFHVTQSDASTHKRRGCHTGPCRIARRGTWAGIPVSSEATDNKEDVTKAEAKKEETPKEEPKKEETAKVETKPKTEEKLETSPEKK